MSVVRGLGRKFSSQVAPEADEGSNNKLPESGSSSPAERVPSVQEVAAPKKRWGVLAVYAASNLLVSLNGFLFPPIATTFEEVYDVGPNAINMISVVSMVTPFLLFFFAMYFVDRHPLAQAYYIGMSFNLVCSWIRYLVPVEGHTGYYTALVTQIFISTTHPFIMVMPTRLSAVHFPLEQRAIATSIATIAGLLGLGLGMAMSPLFKDDVQTLFLAQAVASSIPLLASPLVFRVRDICDWSAGAEPTFGSSEDEAGVDGDSCEPPAKEPFCRTMKRIMADWAFVRLLVMIATGVGTVQTWITLVNQACRPSFCSPESTMIIAGLFFVLGTSGAIISGLLSDRLGDLVKVGRAQVVGGIVFVTVAMVGWATDSAVMVYIGFGLTGFVAMGLLPLTMELGVEYTFVEGVNSEATVCGAVNLVLNLSSAVLVLVSTPGNIFTPATVPWFWEALFLLTAALFFTLPKRYKRKEAAARREERTQEQTLAQV